MLEARDLECERGGRALFRNLSFSVKSSELVRIAGPNGSGKTSLLRILCGLLIPAAGEVCWQGTPIRSLKEEYSRQLVYLGHAPAVKDELTAGENLSATCALAGLPASGIEQAVARFGVPLEKNVKQLSQGQRRRAALARLVVSFTALDREAAEIIRSLVGEHAARGGSVIYSTHQDAGLHDSRVLEL